MKKYLIIFMFLIFSFSGFNQSIAGENDDFEIKKFISTFQIGVNLDESKENLLKISRGEEFVIIIDAAILEKKNDRKYLEKVLKRVERAKYSTFLQNKSKNKLFRAIVDYLYYVVLYTLQNVEEEGTGDIIEKLFSNID